MSVSWRNISSGPATCCAACWRAHGAGGRRAGNGGQRHRRHSKTVPQPIESVRGHRGAIQLSAADEVHLPKYLGRHKILYPINNKLYNLVNTLLVKSILQTVSALVSLQLTVIQIFFEVRLELGNVVDVEQCKTTIYLVRRKISELSVAEYWRPSIDLAVSESMILE